VSEPRDPDISPTPVKYPKAASEGSDWVSGSTVLAVLQRCCIINQYHVDYSHQRLTEVHVLREEEGLR
jgi:hypothetical protein